jgi:hypothetical protein
MELTLTSFPWLPGLRGYDRIWLTDIYENCGNKRVIEQMKARVIFFCFLRCVVIHNYYYHYYYLLPLCRVQSVAAIL